MILFINACVRKNSRTKILADRFLYASGCHYKELQLSKTIFPIVDESFLNKRDLLIKKEDFNNPMFNLAVQFASADEIVMAAPFWDLSFPSFLKQYIEQISVLGITFSYTAEGKPKGLCKADKLTYITTCGGNFFPEEYGAGYIKALAQNFYGISEFKLIYAAGLDIIGADTDKILNSVRF